MTDGGNLRHPGEQGGTAFGSGMAGWQAASPWWSDAQSDPWRDPTAPATVVVRPRSRPRRSSRPRIRTPRRGAASVSFC